MSNYVMSHRGMNFIQRLPMIIWGILKSQKAITSYWLFFNTISGILIAGMAEQGYITVAVATAVSALLTKSINKWLTNKYGK